MSIMTTQEIMEILPHRHPFLLIDTVEELEPGVRVVAKKNVTCDEPYFAGHFPGNPVMPGVVQCEIVAQASCMLFQDALKGKIAYYAGIDKVRFRRMVRPGDTLEMRSELIRQKLNVYVVRGEARVDGELCVSGEFSFILTQ